MPLLETQGLRFCLCSSTGMRPCSIAQQSKQSCAKCVHQRSQRAYITPYNTFNSLSKAVRVRQVMACSIEREARGRPAEVSCMDVVEGKAPKAQEIGQGADPVAP